ncbi:glycosyl hydrolase family 8 [Calothrix sp. 336/3]|uniref:glycosyl hydrolase family 8 n=1 Tax=Calothrix sp. 336/3 TaxID=1337936 RepID=UPI0004E3D61F|nr:glycosyl hydrolase family 8 [Calothrix sp. 336/3]AKG22128.1 glycosyl hydrolase [Calothrix sp. 336/3]
MPCLSRVAVIVSLLGLSACYSSYSLSKSSQPDERANTPVKSVSESTAIFLAALPESTANRQLLAESWDSYRRRFIQSDGRVIDYEASDRSTSEGQAYAMLRAVLINDPETFELTLKWAENNLQRQANGKRTDSLWAWKWGRREDNTWGTIDNNFASDGDIDAITSLIFAARRWNRPEYLELAKTKLEDLWNLSTAPGKEGKHYLLPGPKEAFLPNPNTLYLNPSYLAPYAFRIFAQVDRKHDWLSLVETSYEILDKSTPLSQASLPSDWVALDTESGKYTNLPASKNLQTLYSFDAYRVWWRVSLDAVWFDAPQAKSYLQKSTQYLQKLWQQEKRLPARIDLQGKSLVDYEATSQYAMIYTAWSLIEPQLADEILQQKILPQYQQGIWGDRSAYYTQNLVWLGLLPPQAIPQYLLQTP